MAAHEAMTPRIEADVARVVREAYAARKTIRIVGGGTKQAVGQPFATDITLFTTGLSGIVQYNPAELVFVARAGTPLAEVQKAVDAAGQMLTFEPADWSQLLGTDARQTIGGVAMTNMSGPRRFATGAARDSLLGVRMLNGTGEFIKNGGQVMKNVTGLDLVKLLAGSWGTLGLVTEVSFKVSPKPETALTLAIHSTDAASAAQMMARAMGTSAEVTGAAWLPQRIAKSLKLDTKTGVTLLRLEGFAQSVKDRRERLLARLGQGLEISDIKAESNAGLWSAIRDVTPFADGSQRPVWRISVAPTAGAAIVDGISRIDGAEAFMDWQGGQVWVRLADENDAQASAIRALVQGAGGGHALLVRARTAVRAAIPVFQPETPAVATLSSRIRAAFDPAGIFNPGLMVLDAKRNAA